MMQLNFCYIIIKYKDIIIMNKSFEILKRKRLGLEQIISICLLGYAAAVY